MVEQTQSTAPLKTRQRTFEDEKSRLFTPAVAVIDQDGEHTGTAGNPLSTRSTSLDVLTSILTEMRTMNAHLAEITGAEFGETEHEVRI